MKKILLCIFSLFIKSVSADAFDNSSIEKRLTEVIRVYDERAYVLVDADKKEKKRNLPSLPFVIDTSQGRSDGNIELRKLEITIFSHLDEVPDHVNSVISELGIRHKVKPAIKLNTISPFRNEEKFEPLQHLPYLIGLVIFFALIFIMVQLKNGTQVKKVLETQLATLAQTFSEGTKSSPIVPVTSSASEGGGGKTSVEVNTSTSSNWDQYSQETIIAMLSDCYWCHEDDYASYIWKRLSISMRSDLLEGNMVNSDYVAYISNLDGVDKFYIDEPYYIKPLPINHLSNDELANIIRENTSLMHLISKLRSTHLPIKAKDRLALMSKLENDDFNENVLREAESSELRALNKNESFSFSSLEEEEEVINLPDITISNMEQFPSLAWLTKINSDEARDILNSYTAKQLAGIWIGPESVLDQLSDLLPKKKRELLVSYAENLRPSRESPLYHEVISFAIDQYRKEVESLDQADNKQVA